MLLLGCDKQPAPPSQPVTKTTSSAETGQLDTRERGKPAPPTIFTTPDGKPVTLAAFKGKPLLVNLWATWCGPCVKEMPSLDKLAKARGGTLQVVTVNQTDSAEAIAKWWAPRGFTSIAQYRDEDGLLGPALGSGVLPTTVLFDAQGREVWRVVGDLDWAGPRAADLLRQVATTPSP